MKKKTTVSITLLCTLLLIVMGAFIFIKKSGGSLNVIRRDKVDITSDTLYVDKIENLSDDFIKGVDISSIISLEDSGVKFYNYNGEEQDIFKTLKETGINYIRVRVFHDPYDSNSNSYGGGNNDLDTAIKIGKRAKKHGMKVLVDFHYSDFWADPNKQQVPKAWSGMTIEEKEVAIYEYTKESLKKLKKEKIDVGMVQIGNETTGAFCGENNWNNIAKLFASSSKAIREVNKDIKIVLHFTNPEHSGNYERYAKILDNYKIDYDVFATSYYSFWHGTLENLSTVLKEIEHTYNKQILVAETSYAYTYENGDFQDNTIGDGDNYTKTYPITVQGQATAIRDVMEVVSDIGENGLGVFYWEPAWISVPGETYEEQFNLWETYGSGWASSFANEYDSKDAGIYYGGSAWDNQGLFDKNGKPLESLKVFHLAKEGSYPRIYIDEMEQNSITVRQGNELQLPKEVNGILTDGSKKSYLVSWNESELAALDTNVIGKYVIDGVVTEQGRSYDTSIKVIIMEENYVNNYSFEEEDISMWKIINEGNITTELDVLHKVSDASTGEKSFHFYSTNRVNFQLEQEVTGLKEGEYNFKLMLHGGDCNNQQMYLYAIADGVTYRMDTNVDGWRNFREPEIKGIQVRSGTVTIGIHVEADEKGWGSIDDVSLYPVK